MAFRIRAWRLRWMERGSIRIPPEYRRYAVSVITKEHMLRLGMMKNLSIPALFCAAALMACAGAQKAAPPAEGAVAAKSGMGGGMRGITRHIIVSPSLLSTPYRV